MQQLEGPGDWENIKYMENTQPDVIKHGSGTSPMNGGFGSGTSPFSIIHFPARHVWLPNGMGTWMLDDVAWCTWSPGTERYTDEEVWIKRSLQIWMLMIPVCFMHEKQVTKSFDWTQHCSNVWNHSLSFSCPQQWNMYTWRFPEMVVPLKSSKIIYLMRPV